MPIHHYISLPFSLALSLSRYEFRKKEDVTLYFGILEQVPACLDMIRLYEQNRNKAEAGKVFKDRRKSLAAQRNKVGKINLYATQMHGITPTGQAEAA